MLSGHNPFSEQEFLIDAKISDDGSASQGIALGTSGAWTQVEHHVVLIHVCVADFESPRLVREHLEAQRNIKPLGGRLVLANRQDDFFQAWLGLGPSNQFAQQQLSDSQGAVLGLDIHTPNASLVAPLKARITRKCSGSDELAIGEAAQNEIPWLLRGQAGSDHFQRKIAVFLGCFSESLRFLFQGFQTQPPKNVRIVSGQCSNIECTLGRV